MASIIQMPNGKWRALIRRHGHKPVCKTFPKKAPAEAWARRIEADLVQGSTPHTAGVTVAAMIEKYRALRDAKRPILDTSNEHYMLRHLSEGLGSIDASKLSIDDLLGWCRERADAGAGPYTLNMEISKLGTVLRYAGGAMRLVLPDIVGTARPVLSHFGLIGGGNKRERRPTEDEITRILEHVAKVRHPKYAAAIAFCLASTFRRSETTRIVWADVNETDQTVIVRERKHPRRKVDETVPLTNAAWVILQQQPRVDARCFPYDPQTLSKYFKSACDVLGIADLHLHDLRHDGTSRLFEDLGLDIPEVALFTGHKDWRNLKRYTQLDPAKVRKG